MANRYWVPGGITTNWSDTSNWRTLSGGTIVAAPPGINDGARFDGASGSGTVTLDISPTVQSLSFAPTTSFAGTFAFGTNTVTLNSTGTVFVGSTSMTVTGTLQIILTETTPSATARTLSPAAVTEANSISFRVTGSTGALTLSTGSYRNIDFTDGTNPTGYGGALGGNAPTVYGNFKASTNMTQNPASNSITFAGAIAGTRTINTAGVTFDRPFTFNSTATTATDVVWQLQDALTSGASRTCTLTAGTLDLNGYTLATGIFSSSNSNTRTLAFGDLGKIVITGSGTTVCNTNTATGLTVTGNKFIQLDYGLGVGTRTITGASVATAIEGTNLLNYYFSSGSDTITFTNNCAYNTINFGFFGAFTGTLTNNAIFIYGNFAVSSSMILTSGTNALSFKSTTGTVLLIEPNGQTFNNPITFDGINGVWAFTTALTMGSTQALTLVNGYVRLAESVTSTVGSFVTTGTNQKYLGSRLLGTQATISAESGTNTVSYLTIQDSNATGGATWYAIDPTNVNAGNNTGWIFRDPDTGFGTGSGGTCFGFGFRI
jgi:hypothetical protein